MARWIQVDQPIHDYVTALLPAEDEILQALRTETAALPNAGMQISVEQAQLMQLLVRACGARRCIEVGVFTGYSSLITARALPANGYLLACDVAEDWTQIARRYWQRAGVAERIELVLAPAAETLQARLAAGEQGSFDFAFIDADKTGYETYYELCLQLLRPGGLMLLDNCLWSGQVLTGGAQDPDTRALRAINQKVAADARVSSYLLPVGDGIHLACKR